MTKIYMAEATLQEEALSLDEANGEPSMDLQLKELDSPVKMGMVTWR
ncbi:hypothetical protein TIFTF001_023847 [Ficus carica]|uniref:Uncharacterized protein n=1 Tax=Ficus carica TaxID=3494 RepID=A0AA88ALM6_FICCA|nr:hypothetical protein TIFTF001_023847 [Ficus carica]